MKLITNMGMPQSNACGSRTYCPHRAVEGATAAPLRCICPILPPTVGRRNAPRSRGKAQNSFVLLLTCSEQFIELLCVPLQPCYSLQNAETWLLRQKNSVFCRLLSLAGLSRSQADGCVTNNTHPRSPSRTSRVSTCDTELTTNY